jgi:hypothetical protein
MDGCVTVEAISDGPSSCEAKNLRINQVQVMPNIEITFEETNAGMKSANFDVGCGR